MSASPWVSVVIPVRNGAATIGDTLTGLMDQAPCPSAVEILVVDNDSTDATRAVVEKFPVELLTESRRGPAAARNRGLQSARGEVIAHLDADTLPTRCWLSEIVTPFSDPDVIQVAGQLLSYRSSTPSERYYSRCFLDGQHANVSYPDFPFAASGNMAIRRDAALAIGGWDEEFLASQDVDLSYRLLRRFEKPIRYQPAALAFLHTSRTLAELKAQAFKSGQGRARLWLRHPEAARWSPRWALRVARRLTSAAVRPYLLTAACSVGRASAEDVEQAVCHRAWQWSLWHGFASMIWHREWHSRLSGS